MTFPRVFLPLENAHSQSRITEPRPQWPADFRGRPLRGSAQGGARICREANCRRVDHAPAPSTFLEVAGGPVVFPDAKSYTCQEGEDDLEEYQDWRPFDLVDVLYERLLAGQGDL